MSEQCQMPQGHPTHCGCQQPDRYQSADYCKAIESERDYLRQRVKALHAKAEALLAENGRLAESLRVAHHNLSVGFDTEASLTNQLEAARGLLERVTTACTFEAYGAALHEARTFLTGTPAPEARQAFCDCNQGRLPCGCKTAGQSE